MSHSIATKISAALLAAGCFMSLGSAYAADKVNIGMLVCTGSGTSGKIFKTEEQLSCLFQPNDKSQPTDKYNGSVKQIGIDIGKSGAGQMSWMVMALSKDAYQSGSLEGEYAGVSADAALGVGGGANILVGKNKTFSLQPVSVQAHEGADLAVGVTKFVLTHQMD